MLQASLRSVFTRIVAKAPQGASWGEAQPGGSVDFMREDNHPPDRPPSARPRPWCIDQRMTAIRPLSGPIAQRSICLIFAPRRFHAAQVGRLLIGEGPRRLHLRYSPGAPIKGGLRPR